MRVDARDESETVYLCLRVTSTHIVPLAKGRDDLIGGIFG